jgi:F-type H+-transporting ATPase subunit b
VIPGLSVFWVIFFVLLLAVILDRLLFKPLTRVMAEREARVKSALDLAAQSAERAQAATAEFDERTRAAQTEVYRRMDDMRRAALEARRELLDHTRREVESSVSAARERLAEQAEKARAQLDRQAGDLADAVVTRVLGRKAS